MYVPLEWVIEGSEAEEVGEAHHLDPSNDQHHPQDGRQAFLGVEQTLAPGVCQVAYLLQSLFIENLLGLRGGLHLLHFVPDLVEYGPRLWAHLSPLRKRPLLVYHHPSV